MVHNDPNQRLNDEQRRLEEAKGDTISAGEADAIEKAMRNLGKSQSTQAAYMQSLRGIARNTDVDLSEQSPAELNETFLKLADEKEWAESTESGYQSALKAFVRYHHYEDAADEIEMTTVRKDPSIDPRTVLTVKEFHALRDAATRMRDRAMIDLFGYTGQRLRVIQALRIKDVDVEEGVYYLPDVEGLKGAHKRGRKRPLLGARQSVQEWLHMHPTGNPDDVLISAFEENTGGAEPGTELSATTIKRAIERCADRAGVDKPTNPHAFRHFFVTIAKSQYKMDDSTIKHLIGHGPGSRVMETTYAHLDDDAHIREAREAMGMDIDDDDTTAAPPVCPTCGTPLKPDAKECPTPTCAERFVPGPGLETDPDAAVRETYREAEDMDTVEKVQVLDQLLDDPEVKELLRDRLVE